MSTKRRAYLTEMKTQLTLAVPALLAQIAMISMGFVLLVSRKVDSMAMLVVAGVMIGYICSAVNDIVFEFTQN